MVQRNVELTENLREERPGILRWLIEGCLAWNRDGLKPPDAVINETVEYLDEQDKLAPFITSECRLGPDAKEKASTLFKAYVQWATAEGTPENERLTQTAFGNALKKRGFTQRRSNGLIYAGITVLTPMEKAA